MKVCERCGDEIATRDGENLCAACEESEERNVHGAGRLQKARARRRERDDTMRSLGLTKVRGAMGGTYWE